MTYWVTSRIAAPGRFVRDATSLTVKGEAWMDYCAECNAENERTSPLRNRWACLTCNTTFELGKVRSGPQGWQCPNCKSGDLSPAHGALDKYEGDDVPAQKN